MFGKEGRKRGDGCWQGRARPDRGRMVWISFYRVLWGGNKIVGGDRPILLCVYM
jgi:hypothetical protein